MTEMPSWHTNLTKAALVTPLMATMDVSSRSQAVVAAARVLLENRLAVDLDEPLCRLAKAVEALDGVERALKVCSE